MTSQEMSAKIYRGLFTDEEWNVIDCALSEYQDHFDGSETPEEIAYERVQDKILQSSISPKVTDYAPLLHNKLRRS